MGWFGRLLGSVRDVDRIGSAIAVVESRRGCIGWDVVSPLRLRKRKLTEKELSLYVYAVAEPAPQVGVKLKKKNWGAKIRKNKKFGAWGARAQRWLRPCVYDIKTHLKVKYQRFAPPHVFILINMLYVYPSKKNGIHLRLLIKQKKKEKRKKQSK